MMPPATIKKPMIVMTAMRYGGTEVAVEYGASGLGVGTREESNEVGLLVVVSVGVLAVRLLIADVTDAMI